ncbi:MAG: Smr/MutS family protein [Parcubacteria group bacterium]
MKKTKKKLNIKTLDLHGLNRFDAEFELQEFFNDLKEKNVDKCKIITGWGKEKEPVLFTFTKDWLQAKGYDFDNDLGSFFVYLND